MNIVVDSNIPFGQEAFSRFGRVRTALGREINHALVKDADMLLVRSGTRVDKDLLENSAVRFVGTATIGTDHVDTGYLTGKGIAFASAPGSNAKSVAEYIACALIYVYKGDLATLSRKVLGIVGRGNVGSRVLRIGHALGFRCLVNDPPLQQSIGGKGFVPLEEMIGESDIITLHVPLAHSGDYPTANMVDEAFIGKMKPSAVLINASRGRVVNEKALLSRRSRLGAVVLDVWENEPSIDFRTLAAADIATPHIAGHSYDGKVCGTRRLFDAAAAFLKSAIRWNEAVSETAAAEKMIDVRDAPRPLSSALETAYPIMEDDARLRKIVQQKDPAVYFDELRRKYHKRLEFEHFIARCSPGQRNGVGKVLKNLGFKIRID